MATNPNAGAHAKFVGSIPHNYDTCLGPFLFEFYAKDLARRVEVPVGSRVLEIACGTGITTRALRAALPESVEIVATDLNEPMLEHARSACEDLPNVCFEQADAMTLPFGDASFDAVVCQFGLMFFPDKPQGLREVHRVLKPGGSFTTNTWGSLDANPVIRVVESAVGRYLDGGPPAFFAVPFGYHAHATIRADLTAGGLADTALEVVRTEGQSPAAKALATGFVEGSPGLAEIQERGNAAVPDIVAAVAADLAQAYGDAPLRAPLEAIVVSARRPA